MKQLSHFLSTQDVKANNLKNVLAQRRGMIIRNANTELIHLYWDIGNLIIKKKKVDNKSILELSTKLAHFFTKNIVNQMVLFATLFSKADIAGEFCFFLSWEHILKLLKIKSKKQRKDLIKLSILNHLTYYELEKEVSLRLKMRNYNDIITNLEPETRIAKKRLIKKEHTNYIFYLHECKTIEHLFKDAKFSNFKKLVEPNIITPQKKSLVTDNINDTTVILFNDIDQRITEFSQLQNRLLNLNMNLLFWELGKTIINTDTERKNKYDLSNSSALIIASKVCNGVFKKKHLLDMMGFAKKVKDLSLATWLSNYLSWDYLLILSKLDSTNLIIYHANQVAHEGITLQKLKKEIAESKNITSMKVSKAVKEFNLAIKNTVKKSHIETKNNNTVITKYIDYQFNIRKEPLPFINALKSQHLIKIISAI
jgi:hypothetical protein